jgi:hypothetical protein
MVSRGSSHEQMARRRNGAAPVSRPDTRTRSESRVRAAVTKSTRRVWGGRDLNAPFLLEPLSPHPMRTMMGPLWHRHGVAPSSTYNRLVGRFASSRRSRCRGNTGGNIHPVRCVHSVHGSSQSGRLEADRRIYTRRSRLRALWTEWSVEVRVLSGALGKPRTAHDGAFGFLAT